ncbi:macrophage mannose receptor 1-like [Salarias fasciatus]|uniref:macrophage mannose receptor 1-like n=1 Tax=Salarias fasciatus TaxID=181472 RepID=UPI001176BD4F|nr:macrophage mannose receptor 1-like [Salarias fasciatus]
MRQTEIHLMVISGLCFLPACFPHDYILVQQAFTFPEAQSYCRDKYTDLAVVHSEHDFEKFTELVQPRMSVWIGLQPDTEAWRWSLDDQDHYGEGEAGFRRWSNGEPNEASMYEVCVFMTESGTWFDQPCSFPYTFVCYSKTDSSFVYVNEEKTWDEAQSFCRSKHTDLASVRNLAENEEVRGLSAKFPLWIGLYREAWKWSDGRVVSFDNWAPNYPRGRGNPVCVGSVQGQWVNYQCEQRWYFVCYKDVKQKMVVKLGLQRSDSSVDEEELQKQMLGWFNGRVKELGLEQEISVSWMKQADGKIFHHFTEEEENSPSCPMK